MCTDRQEHRWGLKIEGQVAGLGVRSLPQTSLWPSDRSFHPRERALDTEKLHKAESGAWLGRA